MRELSVNLGIALIPETKEPDTFTEAYKIYNAIRVVAAALDSYTGILQPDPSIWSQLTPRSTILSQNTNRLIVMMGANVTPGQILTLYDNAGVLTAKPAGGAIWAGDGRGWSTGTYGIGTLGEMMLFGLHTQVAGLTNGALYYLSNITAGNITITKPAVPTNTVQPLGFALSATSLFFNPDLTTTIVP